MPNAAFVYDDALSQHVLRSDHPMRPVRLRLAYELLSAYGAFDGDSSRLINPRSATEEELEWVHTPEYIAAVRALSAGLATDRPERFGFSAMGDNPVYPGMYDAATLSSGATLVAAELVAARRVDVAFSISGGLHHAAPTHASGFCIFNDPAIAIKYFLERGMRVAYVDVDAHHGDGVQHVFYGEDRVLTISIHESGRFLFPGTGFVSESGVGDGVGYSVNIPLYPYTEDEPYLWAFREVVPPLVRAFAPDVLVTQLGIDSYHSDPITHLQLTSRGYVEVIREFAKLGLPWLALGGGGLRHRRRSPLLDAGLRRDAGNGVARPDSRGGSRPVCLAQPAGHSCPGGAGQRAAGGQAVRGGRGFGVETGGAVPARVGVGGDTIPVFPGNYEGCTPREPRRRQQ